MYKKNLNFELIFTGYYVMEYFCRDILSFIISSFEKKIWNSKDVHDHFEETPNKK